MENTSCIFNPYIRPDYAILENNAMLLLKQHDGSTEWDSGAI